MTTAYRADLVRTVYESEIAKLAAGPSIRTEAIVVSCRTTTCGVQYSLLRPRDITEEEIAKHTAAVEKAMRHEYCPHHPPKIALNSSPMSLEANARLRDSINLHRSASATAVRVQ